MTNRTTGEWKATGLRDMLGKRFDLGQKVVKGYTSGRAVNLEIREVTNIKKLDDGTEKLYLSGSKVPVNYPGRLLILEPPFDVD